jgi:hypothetical protein
MELRSRNIRFLINLIVIKNTNHVSQAQTSAFLRKRLGWIQLVARQGSLHPCNLGTTNSRYFLRISMAWHFLLLQEQTQLGVIIRDLESFIFEPQLRISINQLGCANTNNFFNCTSNTLPKPITKSPNISSKRQASIDSQIGMSAPLPATSKV